ncbi:MAG: glycoside hydrolase family 20 zincin-like fold domain-containing protein, partial [Planctomycetota bacterium]
MTAKTTILTMSFMLPFLVSFGVASETVVPARENGELVLFDADKHGPEVFRNYTASWIEGSNLVPLMRQVSKNGEMFIAISYQKERGLAISLIRFESLPMPLRGMQYNGIRLVIDYDKDDYSHIEVTSKFLDETQLTSRLVLEQGTNEYVISSGFRRAEYPPDWNLLSWVWLAVNTNKYGHDRNVTYRLRRITLVEEQEKNPVLGTVNFGDRVFCPEPKQIIWKEGEFPARIQTHIYLSPIASARTWRTAEIFLEKYLQHSGRRLVTEELGEELPDEGIILRIADSVVSNGSVTHLNSEGYNLVVEPQRVVITGADEPGLYYGGMTFFQLMKNSMRIEDSMPVPCVEILDWPDLPNRMCRLEHPHHFKWGQLKENRGIDFLIE